MKYYLSLPILLTVAYCGIAADDESAKLFDDFFGKRYRAALITPEGTDNHALATSLLQALKASELPTEFVVLVANKATDLASQSPESYQVTIDILEFAASKAPKQKAALDDKALDILEHAAKATKDVKVKTAAGEVLIDRLDALARVQEKAQHITEAVALYKRSVNVAREIRSSRLGTLEQKVLALGTKSQQASDIDALEKRLEANPADAEARQALIDLHLIQRDDPNTAVWFVGEKTDQDAKTNLPLAAKDGTGATPKKLVGLGEWYQSLSARTTGPAKLKMLQRADRYFDTFLEVYEKNDLTRAKGQLLGKKVKTELSALASLIPAGNPTGTKRDPRVVEAIKAYQNLIFEKQSAAGIWEAGTFARTAGETGVNAIVVYSLLQSGISPDDPRLTKAIKHLLATNYEKEGTYSISIQARVFSLLGPKFKRTLQDRVNWLVAAGSEGTWSYKPKSPNSNRHDHSNTGYAMIGLWYADQAGARIDRAVWQNALTHFVKAQNLDGGWNYRAGDSRPSYLRMTAESLMVIEMAKRKLTRGPTPVALKKVIEKGNAAAHKMMEEQKSSTETAYGFDIIERWLRLSGQQIIDGKDRFASSREELMDHEKYAVSTKKVFDLALNLGTLVRQTPPTWCARLVHPDGKWRQDTADVQALTEQLRTNHRGLLNFKQATLDDPIDSWGKAPIAYVAGPIPIKFTDKQLATLKQYIDTGGLLVASGSSNMRDALIASLKQIYPVLKVQPLASDHPILNAHHKLNNNAAPGRPSTVVRLGSRIIAFMPSYDWTGMLRTGRTTSRYFQLAENLVVWQTNQAGSKSGFNWKPKD